MNSKSKVTIITVSYNAVNTIEETILSVINQTYPNIEYIIIDGGSTDGTVDIIKKYSNYISYWVSESDKGIYDAMNKGAFKATGKFIQFLNAGDWLYDNNVLTNIFNNKNYENVDVIYGDMIIRRLDGKFYASAQDLSLFKNDFPLFHPSTFVSKSTFLKYKFDISYRISADFKILRDIYYANGIFKYLPFAFTNFDGIYGISSSGYAFDIFKERGRITGENNSVKWKVSCLSFLIRLKFKAIIKFILSHTVPQYFNKIQYNRIPKHIKKVS